MSGEGKEGSNGRPNQSTAMTVTRDTQDQELANVTQDHESVNAAQGSIDSLSFLTSSSSHNRVKTSTDEVLLSADRLQCLYLAPSRTADPFYIPAFAGTLDTKDTVIVAKERIAKELRAIDDMFGISGDDNESAWNWSLGLG